MATPGTASAALHVVPIQDAIAGGDIASQAVLARLRAEVACYSRML